jgi:hypothetical protein
VLTGPFTLSVNGAGFVPGAVATTYGSPTARTATGTAIDAQIGTVNNTVANPNPGAVVSQPKAVTVQAAPVKITVTVSPNPASVVVGTTRQFTATVQGTSNMNVTWRVNDVDDRYGRFNRTVPRARRAAGYGQGLCSRRQRRQHVRFRFLRGD